MTALDCSIRVSEFSIKVYRSIKEPPRVGSLLQSNPKQPAVKKVCGQEMAVMVG